MVVGLEGTACFSQPNGGFENWYTVFSSESPVGWQTLNFLQFTLPPNPISAFKVSGLDKHSGNYALKIKTVHLNNNPLPNVLDDTMGLSFTGVINISPSSYRYGFPYAGRPEKLEFWYKYLPVGADQGGVRVTLTRWNGVKTDTLAFAEDTISYNPNYGIFELPLTYFSNEIPDSATIFLASSRHRDVARVGTTLYLDDMAFTGWVGIDEKNSHPPKIYPNPASDNITFSNLPVNADVIEVADVTGKKIESYKLKDTNLNISTVRFNAGTYLYTVIDTDKKTIFQGKFSIVK